MSLYLTLKTKLVRLLFVCLLCCSVTATRAQSQQHPDLPFEHVDIPGTISSSQVNDLIQDHRGLIWVAGNGLYRYDGYRFTVYKNISDSVPIAGQEINGLFSDPMGDRLLIGTHSHGIVSFDYTQGKFSIIPSKGGTPIISHIAQTSDGTIWGSSFSNGLFVLEHDTLRQFSNSAEALTSNSYITSQNSKLFVGGNRTVYVIENKQLVDSITIEFPGFNFSPVTRVTAISTDRSSNLWIGTEQSGVFVYNMNTRKFVKHFSPDTSPFHNRVNKIMEDRNGRVWILIKGEGLVVYSPSTGNYIRAVKNPLSERSLSGDNCTSIIQDRSNIIWVGATGDLNKYDPSKIKFRHIYNNPFAITSLHDNMVRGVYEDTYKKLWVGTDGGVVHIFNETRLSVEKIELRLEGQKRISPLYFMDLNRNILLIGTSHGMLQYDRATKRIGYFKPLEQYTKGQQVRQMIIHNNILYYISFGGLKAYNMKTGEFSLLHSRNDPNSIVNATTLYVDKSNRFWVGDKKGIALLDSATNLFTHFTFKKDASRPLGTYFMILSIQDFKDKLWIGTFNDGLWTLDPTDLKNPVITHVSKNRDTQNMTVYSTLPDKDENLWMSTNSGIIKYIPSADKYLDFTVTEGLQQEEFNRLSFAQCANGDIVYGGINGLNIFNPMAITLVEEDYTPVFLNVSVLDEEVNAEIPVPVDSSRSFTLEEDQNNITISFFVANYRTPRRYDSFYKLEGYNPEWIKAESNSAHYANLKPGTYDFSIKTVSISGKEKIASLNFTVKPPVWQTWWFITLAMIAVCLIVVTIIQGSLYKSRRDKERLETLLNIRTQEIEKSREELANLNQKKDLIFSILSHDLRSPLTTLKGFLSILIDDHELTQADIKKHASNIRNSVTSSLDLIDNTLFWSLSQTGNISYTPATFLLNETLQKVASLYQLVVSKKRINFSIELSEEIKLFADENMAYVTLRNIVSNALKFTPPGNSVTIKAFARDTMGVVIIEDEGIGMSQSYLEKLFTDEQLPLTKGTNDEKGTGIGLILCRKFIQMNKGKLQVKSVEGKGSQFIVELPLAQD